MSTPYRGRFAPTPSGPLHLGSLMTALAGFLQARSQGGQWLLRMDDLDAPRCKPGADTEIQRQLEAHGLHWDGPVYRQSAHTQEYREALESLSKSGVLYPCRCTRAELARDSRDGPDGPIYAGTCRGRAVTPRAALRLRLAQGELNLDDGWQGPLQRQTDRDIGDFILRRADGQIAYQLASAVDEVTLSITEVVRGHDLLGSSFRQIHLLQVLGRQPPRYRHLPVLVGEDGRKLSKQNHAMPARSTQAVENLLVCLNFLGQQAPEALRPASVSEIVEWAIQHWNPLSVPRQPALKSQHFLH